ncbi:MAG: hypothetical protein COB81_09695 [Flavobacteriaceae bacterium]|nr:MAG: hypothetical protein COB81_09695 [Flavobacteriaceae bacterium]
MKPTYKELEKQVAILAKTNKVIESSLVVIFHWQHLENCPVSFVSKNVSKIFGYTYDDFLSKKINYGQTIHKEDLLKVSQELEFHCIIGSNSFTHEPYRIISKSGHIKWIKDETYIIKDETGKITHYEGVIIDITKQIEAEQELIKSKKKTEEDKEQLDFVLHGSDLGYWDWNIKTNEVKRNRRWAEMLGYTYEEIKLTVNQWTDFIYHEDTDKALASIKDLLEGNTTFHQLEYRMLTKSGQLKWILDCAKIVKRDKNGSPLRMSGTHLDITERKKTEESLKKSAIKLLESNATKDKFFSIIAHDLKSPFNSLLGISKIFNDKFDEYNTEKKKLFINCIHQGLENTYKLVNNLLQWSQSQTGVIVFNPVKTNLYLKTKEVCDIAKQAAENKSIHLINQISNDIYIESDVNMLATIIRNLLSNAIKYTRKSGEITIKTFLVPEDNQHKFVGIIISDTGIGIPKEIQSKLFKIGEYTAIPGTENERGTGLGLILCKEFVEKHGGEIWVESNIGKGSSFYFTIPYKSKKMNPERQILTNNNGLFQVK